MFRNASNNRSTPIFTLVVGGSAFNFQKYLFTSVLALFFFFFTPEFVLA